MSVLNWIRSFREEIASLGTESEDIEMVESDEMHSYVGSQKTTIGFGLLLIDLEKDSSTSLLVIEETRQQSTLGLN